MPVPPDLEAFCRQEYPRLTRLLDAQLGDLEVAEELAQEALLRATRHWARVSHLESPGGWVHRVAINLATSWFRRQQAGHRARRRHGPVGDVHVDPDTAVIVAMREAIAALPTRQRTAVLLRHHAQFSVSETAVAMGASPDAVRSLTKRALAGLRRQLDEESPTFKEKTWPA